MKPLPCLIAPLRGCLLPGLEVPSSLRSRILSLVLALALAMGTLAGIALWQAYATAQDQVANQLLATARAMARVVDREFARAEALLQGLALMPSIRDGDFTGFIESGRIAGDILGLPDMALAGPDGRQRASTMATHERLAQGLPAAPEAMRVFRSGRTEISDFSEGSAAEQPRILVAVPVRAGRDRAGALCPGADPAARAADRRAARTADARRLGPAASPTAS